jgi:hypothetical protein
MVKSLSISGSPQRRLQNYHASNFLLKVEGDVDFCLQVVQDEVKTRNQASSDQGAF